MLTTSNVTSFFVTIAKSSVGIWQGGQGQLKWWQSANLGFHPPPPTHPKFKAVGPLIDPIFSTCFKCK